MNPAVLPANFRKLPPEERKLLWEQLFFVNDDERSVAACPPSAFELADLMVESAVGTLPLPLGIVSGFIVNGEPYDLPLAVEEPSVIAAAGYAASIIGKAGGFQVSSGEPLLHSYVYLEAVSPAGEAALAAGYDRLIACLDPVLAGLSRRGGGLRQLRQYRLPETGLLALELLIDVRDAMGANIVNTAAEAVRPLAEELSGGRSLMCILSNASPERRAQAAFCLPLKNLAPYCRGLPAEDIARRIVLAAALADEDPARAVTHNKGVMNGIAALAQATMNDTRAIEAAAHSWAARSGRLRSLTAYRVADDCLHGSIDLPLAFATVGGSVDLHPVSRACLALMGKPDSMKLAALAAALGLAQNFAALLALVSGGIQGGHMRLHSARLAYRAGARGAQTRLLADRLAARHDFSLQAAREEYNKLQGDA
ncbi:MAG: hydroxymethylglutaryl-CoA reductase, degradative [Spirochaetes bacterium]|nr:hydroxymethylglutaryl-CoA reductase, degradative [Spirochaetota bacterium]